MITTNLDGFVCVPLPTDLYNEVLKRYPDRVSTLIRDVTEAFLENTKDDFSSDLGFYWDSLFLPSYTELRVKESRSNNYGVAKIINEQVIYEGNAMKSVSQFASKVRNNTSVNAWITVEIKRPNDHTWKLADKYRR